jgi:hypothetical protein
MQKTGVQNTSVFKVERCWIFVIAQNSPHRLQQAHNQTHLTGECQMRRKGLGWLSVLWIGSLAFLPGCTSGEFGEEFRNFLTDTTKDAALAVGTFIVEQAVEQAFR